MDMENENGKLQGSDIDVKLSNPFFKWLDNFWYHHKWKVIIIAFFAIVIVVGVVQMINKEECDVEVTVATHTIYYTENVDALEKALVGIMPSDINGDGKKKVQLNLYKIYSESELKDANEAETDEDENPIIYADPTYNKEQISQFNSYIMTGQCTVMIVSEYVYDDLVGRREDDILLKPMSEIFGEELPRGVTADGYGIKLSECGAYSLDAFRTLPNDSIICIMRPFVMSGNANSEKYEKTIEYFKSIVEFGME